MCCWAGHNPATGTLNRLLSVNEKSGHERPECETALPAVQSRMSLRSRLRELRVFVEITTENMDYAKPRNHRTLEIEYRRLRRQFHQKADDNIFRRFREPTDEIEQKAQQMMDLRSGSQLILQNKKHRSAESKQGSERKLVIRGRDLCRSAEDIVRKERIRYSKNDFAPRKYETAREPPVSCKERTPVKHNETYKETLPVTHKEPLPVTHREVNTERSQTKPQRLSPSIASSSDNLCEEDNRSRSSKSNSKGHRVRFAPEVRLLSAPSCRDGNRSQRKTLNVKITSVSSCFYSYDEPRFTYTTRAMALMPVASMG